MPQVEGSVELDIDRCIRVLLITGVQKYDRMKATNKALLLLSKNLYDLANLPGEFLLVYGESGASPRATLELK